MLDVVFALDRQPNVVVLFEVDEAFDRIPFGESWNEPIPVLVDSANEIVRNAHV